MSEDKNNYFKVSIIGVICILWILIVIILYYVNFASALYRDKPEQINKLLERGIQLIERIIN